MGIRPIIPILATLLAGSAPAPGIAGGNGTLACPASADLANLARNADLIVLGQPRVDSEAFRTAMDDPSPDYLDVPLDRVSVLKGKADSAGYIAKVYPKDQPYSLPKRSLLDLSGKPSILFLSRIDEGNPGLFLLDSPDAIQPYAPSTAALVEAEVERQEQILRLWKPRSGLNHYRRIRRLLAGLPTASRARQMSIFRELEKLGEPAVPALIAQMDDRRPLAHQEISLENHSPDAFEGIRHYGPKLVVDAIDAILNQLNGNGGSIVSGGSERERRNAVAAWRVYDADHACRGV